MPFRATLPFLAATLVACATGAPGGGASGGAYTELGRVIFDDDTLRVEVARSEEDRARGLMFRDSLPDGTGMLFVFPSAEIQGVWMKDTGLTLDAAFLDTGRRIVGIEPLEPFDETVKYAQAPVLYVLEAPRGWLARHGVSVGDIARIEIDGP